MGFSAGWNGKSGNNEVLDEAVQGKVEFRVEIILGVLIICFVAVIGATSIYMKFNYFVILRS